MSDTISLESGNCYVTAVPFHRGDEEGRKVDSELYENGKPLGLPHTLHEEIRRSGAGRYSHWHNTLFFSTSDNTDPRYNGRQYELQVNSYRHLASRLLFIALLILGALTAIMSGIFPILLGTAVLLVTTAGLACYAIKGVGFLRHPSISSIVALGEYALPAMLLFWALSGFLLSWSSRVDRRLKRFYAWRRFSRRPEVMMTRHLRRWGFIYALALPMLTLLSIWAVPESPSTAEWGYSALFGQLPWGDAREYFDGAHRLLTSGQLDAWNSRRPVNAAFLSTRFALTNGDAHGAIILQVLLLGITLYLLCQTIGSELGIWAGLATYALIWCWSRAYFPATLSETLGVSLGAWSFALLFKGMRRGAASLLILGLFGMAFAQASRMGALMMLPMLLAWIGWVYRDRGIVVTKYIGMSLLLITLGFGTNFILVYKYGNKNIESVGSNFAPVIHGLAANSRDGWAYFKRFEEIKQLPEAELNKRLYHDAWGMIQRDPRPLMYALWTYNLRPFFQNFTNHIFSGFYLWDANVFHIRAVAWIAICFGLLLYFLREKANRDLSFWIAGTVGILLSVPIIYQNSGWRALATTYPSLACLLSCGLSLPRIPKRKSKSIPLEWRISGLLIGVWLLSICGPMLAKRLYAQTMAPAVHEVSSNEAVISGGNILRSTSVLSGTKSLHGVTAFNEKTLRSLLGASGVEIREELNIKLPQSIPYMLGMVYDYSRQSSIYIVAPPDLLNEGRGYLRLTLRPLLDEDHRIYNVLDWSRIP